MRETIDYALIVGTLALALFTRSELAEQADRLSAQREAILRLERQLSVTDNRHEDLEKIVNYNADRLSAVADTRCQCGGGK